eukprot:gb/GECG01010500.1/.p1 GENE.gb/GECG01010500.1/~~gb/GECG01010500.1/.p1  ORF type:complete len:298 (+),score=30.89 gb/GECG01010500.1/:1-894(+)
MRKWSSTVYSTTARTKCLADSCIPRDGMWSLDTTQDGLTDEIEMNDGLQITPLMFAAASDDLDSVDALLERLNPEEADYENNSGHTALRYAAIYTSSNDIINHLLRHGCNPDRISVAGGHGHTPLYDAVLHDNCSTAGALLHGGASPHLSFAFHPSPCSIALSHEESHPKMLEQFLPFLPWQRRRLVVMSRHVYEARSNMKQRTSSGTELRKPTGRRSYGSERITDRCVSLGPKGRRSFTGAPIPSPHSCLDVTEYQAKHKLTDKEIRQFGSGVRLGNGPPGLGYTMLQQSASSSPS